MPNVTINGKPVDVPKGTPIIRAAALLGINIPHFCYHPALSAPANCRMCLVEIAGARKLEPACYMKCADGMAVTTESDKVHTARRSVLEFILVNHPVDCPICDQAGECKLQDYYMAYDARPSRVETEKNGKVKAHPIGPHVVYDGERCILCTRCIRFCDEITGTSELTVIERGDRSEIRTFPGRELDNAYSMCVTDLCPVGALTTRDFRFKVRVWLLSSTNSICTGCSRGCNVHMEHYQGRVRRYRPRFNAEVNEYWMCDQGRLSYATLHTDRIDAIRVGELRDLKWPRAAREASTRIATAVSAHPGAVAMLVSAQASCESLYAARLYAEKVLGGAAVYTTGKAAAGFDDFLIRADKNPNRMGIAAVFGEDALSRTETRLLEAIEAGKVRALVMSHTDLPFDAAQFQRFKSALARLDLLVLVSPFAGDLAAGAHIVLPTTTHAEMDATYINEDGMVQSTSQAVPTTGDALPEWAVYVRLARAAGVALGIDSPETIHAQLFERAAAE